MDLLGILTVVVRRWQVTVPILLLTLGVAVYVDSGAGNVYEASGSILVSEPQINPETDPVALTETAAVARDIRASDESAALSESQNTTEVIVDAVDDQSIRITVSGSPTAEVRAGATLLADATTDRVAELQDQAGVAASEQIRALAQRVDVSVDAESGVATATVEVFLDDPMGAVANPFAPNPATGRLLQVSTLSDAGREEVDARTNGEIEFELDQDPRDSAPILQVLVIAQSPDAALNGFTEVVDVVSTDLDRRQGRAGVRSNERLVIEVLAEPQRARDVSPPVSRSVAVTVALGVLVALGAAILAENLAARAKVARTDDPGVPDRLDQGPDRLPDRHGIDATGPKEPSEVADELQASRRFRPPAG